MGKSKTTSGWDALSQSYDDDGFFHSYGDYMLAVSAGLITGITTINKFGENPSSAIDTVEDLWDGGGTYSFPATALIVKMSQTADQEAMRGETIEIQGLDANWELVIQEKALHGTLTTTPVVLDTPLIRVFRAKVLSNIVGDSPIRIHNSAENVDYAIISVGNNQTGMAIYTVPAGKTAYMTKYYISITRTSALDPTGTDCKLWTKDNLNGYAFQFKHAIGLANGATPYSHTFIPYLKVTEKTDIKLSTLCGDKAGNVHGGFDLILVDD